MTETTSQRIERVARAICWQIERPCDGECSHAGECQGAPAPVFIECARAADAISFAAGWAAAIEALCEHGRLVTYDSAEAKCNVLAAADWLAAHRPPA